MVTNYTDDLLNHLTVVSMPRVVNGSNVTQTRTWVYDPATQRLSSATNPENGTVSYTYNTDGTLFKKTDARGVVIQYTYDSLKRPTLVQSSGSTLYNYTYDTPADTGFMNTNGRIASVTYYPPTGQVTEVYGYTAPGGLAGKRMWVYHGGYSNPYADMVASFGYDTEGKPAT